MLLSTLRGWVPSVGAASAVAVVAVLMSCRQLVGITDSPPLDLSTTACGLPYGTTACASCVSAGCCDPSSACAGDSVCQSYFACLGTCTIGDPQCRSQCGVDHPYGGAAEFPILSVCMASHCAEPCGVTCGSVVSAGFSFSPGAAARCETCFEANDCALEAGICATSTSCMGWLQCTTACRTPDCRDVCSRRYGYDGGVSIGDFNFGALPPSLESLSAACKTPCLAGSNWSCVGRVDWPAGTMGGTKLEAQILSFATSAPVQDADVKICGATDPSCQRAPIPEATSNANGFVAVDVPPTTSVLGGLTADTFAQINAAGYVPELVFLGYPVSEPLANIAEPTVYLVTPGDLQASGSTWDMTNYGQVDFEVLDCDGVAASGVQVAIDVDGGQMQEFYFENLMPIFGAKATDSTGLGGGFVNVPEGNVTLTATPLTLGKPSSHADVIVRKGTITQAFLFPTP